MKHVQKIGIIGAGLSGLVTAKTCLEYGYTVKVFEKEQELGGVWASSRRYPGIATQNTKDTYCFTDFPMPNHYPQWPSGKQVQSYLESYARNFHVFPLIEFSHEITTVDFQNSKWIIRGKNGSRSFTEQVDFLVVCNGTFSDPYIPAIPGMDGFKLAGGQILHSTDFQHTEMSKNKRVMVVGYGKSASDLVTAVSETAKNSFLVFREPKWKIPRYFLGMNMKYLLLNRLGESFVKPAGIQNRMDRFVHRIGLAKSMVSLMEKRIARKQNLKVLGLLPTSTIQDQAFGEISLETPGFFEKIDQKKIIPLQGEIISFNGKQVRLSGGETIECDLVIFAIGFKQDLPFLPDNYKEKLMDEQGNYILYRHILPSGIPSFAFVGYNTSIQCPISSEFGALWVCEYLKGRIAAPDEKKIIKDGKAFIKWRSQFRPNGSCKALSTMPGTIHHVDILLKDMNAPMPLLSLIPDWLILSAPRRYRKLRDKIAGRNNKYNHGLKTIFYTNTKN